MNWLKRKWADWNRAQRIGWSVVVGLVALLIIGGLASIGDKEERATQPAADQTITEPAPPPPSPPTPEPPPPPPTPTPAPPPSATPGQENARGQAESYLEYQAFSRKGLIEQLKFEGYTTGEATWAVDHVQVNWNEQAAKKAASYLESQSFSRSGLLDQLLFEGFTQAQAEHGVQVAYR